MLHALDAKKEYKNIANCWTAEMSFFNATQALWMINFYFQGLEVQKAYLLLRCLFCPWILKNSCICVVPTLFQVGIHSGIYLISLSFPVLIFMIGLKSLKYLTNAKSAGNKITFVFLSLLICKISFMKHFLYAAVFS